MVLCFVNQKLKLYIYIYILYIYIYIQYSIRWKILKKCKAYSNKTKRFTNYACTKSLL